jgi:hypothetical protein
MRVYLGIDGRKDPNMVIRMRSENLGATCRIRNVRSERRLHPVDETSRAEL